MNPDLKLVMDRYAHCYGASVEPTFGHFLSQTGAGETLAVLGYSRAGTAPLFLERYLDEPIEYLVSATYQQEVPRDQIVEIGNLVACNGWALVRLWGQAANDLGGEMEFAVATLTASLRAMFARIGLPVRQLAPAMAERAGDAQWGRYYQSDPWVCVGRIAEGQSAITRFLAKRSARAAA